MKRLVLFGVVAALSCCTYGATQVVDGVGYGTATVKKRGTWSVTIE